MKKNKILKISGIVILVIIGILVAIPFFLEGRIGSLLRSNVNNSINGTFDFEKANLSLIKSFPNAHLSVEDMYIVNAAPFEGDTLVKARKMSLTMGLGELFKGAGEPIGVRNLEVDGARLNILVDEEENANYDIAKETEPAGTESSGNFSFDLQSYTITDTDISYKDRSSGISLVVEDIEHRGSGDLSLEESELQTFTNALVSLEMDSTNYLNRNLVQLEALIGINLKENKYSFLKNEALVNQLPLVFEGYVQVFDTYQDVNLQFRTPSSDFKNFLAVIPETYTKNIEGVQTSGNFVVEGNFNGRVDETHIPQFSIEITSENASFKYPDLPKAVSNINIDALVRNTTGIAEDTYVELNKVSFSIDSDQFNMQAKIRELMGNPKVEAQLSGSMNLANISSAYPVPADLNLKGRLEADINTAFDMASVEKKQYENTRTNGFFNLSGFEYSSPELANPVAIKSMTVEFNPRTVNLKTMEGNTGSTDFKVNGTLNNLLGFMFNKELVEGQFNLSSNTFALNDFMVEEQAGGEGSEEKETPKGEERIKIPSFLDCTIQASANTVVYDNLQLKNVSGTLRIKDETATLSNLTSSIFDGKLALSGTVSTKEVKPTFSVKLGMEGLRISETFQSLDLLKALAPVANALEGRLNSQIDISGLLTDDFTPDLATITGNALANLLGTEIIPEQAPILNELSSKLNFINVRDFDLGNLKTALNFENGLVNINPITLNYKDIAINIDGSHSFDRNLNYTAVLQVPSKYLGKEVNDLIAKINDEQLQNLTIPVTAAIGGKYNSPDITTDFSSGVKNLTTQLVEIQKQKLIDQGKDKARDLIGGLLTGNKGDTLQPRDSTKTPGVRETVGGILNRQGEADTTGVKDTTAANAPVKQAAKDILGGLLNKKKREAAKKDSIN